MKLEKYFSSTGKVLEFIKGLGKVLELIKGPGKSWKNTLSTACGEGNVTVEIPPKPTKPNKKRIFFARALRLHEEHRGSQGYIG